MVHHVDIATLDEAAFRAQLNMSFLGQHHIYWLSDISNLKKEFTSLLKYVSSYQGPNAVWFFSEKPLQSENVIALPTVIDATAFAMLAQELFDTVTYDSALIYAIFEKKRTLSFEDAFKVMQYMVLVSKAQRREFIEQYLNKLIVPESSLFMLSSLFFGKKTTEFFALLESLQEDYPPVFWFSFWSDQLFRARWFIYYARLKQIAEAKAIAYKLPFTFIKRDWQLYTVDKLDMTHQYLYTIDYRFKNGCSSEQLELFYHTFFLKE